MISPFHLVSKSFGLIPTKFITNISTLGTRSAAPCLLWLLPPQRKPFFFSRFAKDYFLAYPVASWSKLSECCEYLGNFLLSPFSSLVPYGLSPHPHPPASSLFLPMVCFFLLSLFKMAQNKARVSQLEALNLLTAMFIIAAAISSPLFPGSTNSYLFPS